MRTADLQLQQRRRHEIVAAAVACFAQRGFHQSSMQDIATGAGVSMGLLYRYFKNKQAIIEAVANIEREKTLAALAVLPADGFTKRHTVAGTWAAFILELVRESTEPKLMLLVNEVAAEAGRVPQLHAILKAHDEALSKAVEARLKLQKQNGFWPSKFNVMNGAQFLLLLVDGLVARRWSSPQASEGLDQLYIERVVAAMAAS
jgi:TetR/AcrR family transcriptional regulator, repressor for uid operon